MNALRLRRPRVLAALLLGLGLAALAGLGAPRAHADDGSTVPGTYTVSTAPALTSTVGDVTTVTPTHGLPYRQLSPYRAQAPTAGALESDGQTGRDTLAGTWLFQADPSDTGVADGLWCDRASTAGWSEVAMPNSWNAGNLTAAGFAGTVGWYRRDFTLPAHAFAKGVARLAQSWEIEFESVNYGATVWLNGRELGSHEGAYLPFSFVANGIHSGVNRLVVRVDDTRTLTSFPAGPASGWWNFGGILDAVYLHPVQEADLETATIRPMLACPRCAADVQEQATVQNRSPRSETVELSGRFAGRLLHFGTATLAPGQIWTPSAQLRLVHPRLWAPAHPYLYSATLTLSTPRGTVLGGYRYRSGVREITWQNGLLYLNGQQLHLRGVSVHEQTIQTGAALDVAQQAQLISWTHQLGADIIREHYPLDPEAEEMADADGILLWSEIPVYGSFLSTSQADGDLSSPTWRAAAAALLADNIETNENHASILLWSIGNELPATVTGPEESYITAASAEAHALDPTRPVGMAVEDWPGLACQATAYAPLDVIGINEYFAWFDEAGGATENREDLAPFLQSQRSCYPNKVLMVTEVGYGADRDGPQEVRGTYPYQDDMLSYSMGIFNSLSWLSGAIWFPMQDFAVEPGYDGGEPLGDPPFVDKGVIDAEGNEKPSFQVMSTLYHDTSQVGP